MAGIYIHIPFCTKACHYCNFHFSTSLQNKSDMLQCMLQEIVERKFYLQQTTIESIYFGGGTPSVLDEKEIYSVLETITKHFTVAEHVEITLEANPDDLTTSKLKQLFAIGINRLSIGIQSFFDEDLIYMNRSHNAAQALRCIPEAQTIGITNISADLIFGYPLLSDEKWERNMQEAIRMQIPHLSCYAMTIEPKTALAKRIAMKKEKPLANEQLANQFRMVMETLEANQYEHYEISNYALANQRSKHNSNYWKGISYLGIGPSAHSFDGKSRQWNIASNAKYISGMHAQTKVFEKEVLTPIQVINETIMLSLRTKEGLNTKALFSTLSAAQKDAFQQTMQQFLAEEKIQKIDDRIYLTTKGKLFADYISGSLFVEENE
jgi:oxygen-independent coproporphyrinogen-3 oxidase